MELVETWANWQRMAGLSDSTIRTRSRTLKRLRRDHGPFDTISRDDIVTWLGQYDDPGTRSSFLSYIRCFYRWAVDEEHLPTDPTRRVPRVKTARRQPRPVDTETLHAALLAAPPREQLWIELMAWAGLRVSEVAGVQPNHAQRNADGRWWLVIPRAKGGHRQAVALPTWLGEKVRGSAPVAVGATTVTMRVGAVLRAVGSTDKPHALRHYYGTALLATTGNLRIAQQGLRHADLSTTQVYTLVTNSELSDAVENLPRATA